MTISPEVLDLAKMYNIKVETTSGLLGYVEHKALGIHIFNRCGLSFAERKVWLTEDADISMQLHEVMHLITHPPGCHLNVVRENFVLMQVEREIARTIFGRGQFLDVVSWQQVTIVSDDEQLFKDKRSYWRSRDLWLGGYERAQQLGLLDAKRRPTFRPATWPDDPARFYFEWQQYYDVVGAYRIEDVRA